MKTLTVLTIAALCLAGSHAQAEFMEIQASQIVTIESTEKEGKPSILVQWALPDDLDELIIDGAVITMTLPVDSASPMDVEVHRVEKAWNAVEVESLEAWAQGDKVYDADVTSPAIVTAENEGVISADVYLQIRDQVFGDVSNFGFIVVPAVDAVTAVEAIEANASDKLMDAKLIIAYRTRR